MKKRDFWDYMIPAGFLILSCMLSFLLPDELGFKGWIVFGIAVVMFCIGFFSLLQKLPEPETPGDLTVRKLVLIAIGVLLFLFSLYYVYTERGSEKSLAVAILSMIESMIMCTYYGNHPGDGLLSPKTSRTVYLVLMIGLACIGTWCCILDFFSEPHGLAEAGTLLWIAAIWFWHNRRHPALLAEVAADNKKKETNQKGERT